MAKQDSVASNLATTLNSSMNVSVPNAPNSSGNAPGSTPGNANNVSATAELPFERPNDLAREETAKLVYGVVFSLRNLVNKLSPKPSSDAFKAYRTPDYKLHYFETASGLKFVMNTDPMVDTEYMKQVLRGLYADVYVETVAKNPLVAPQDPISNQLFRVALENYVRGLSVFF